MKCDFCSGETTKEDVLVLPVDRFNIPELNYWNFSWGWGACPECAPLLRSGDWLGLVARASLAQEKPELFPILATVYLGLQQHTNGPLRGWSAQDESTDDT